MEPLSKDDLNFITKTLYNAIPSDIINRMVDFNEQVFLILSLIPCDILN